MTRSVDLPQLGGRPFLIDGGLETYLMFVEGFELPSFASITLLESEAGVAGLSAYYHRYLAIAREHGAGFVLEAPTWRASPEWGAKLGFDAAQLADLNRRAIALIAGLREADGPGEQPIVLNAAVGPRGDGYDAGAIMTPEEARDYHRWQIETLAAAGVELITALTMTNVEEALGIAGAAADAGLPVAVSFTVETDGRLPTGMALSEAVARVDDAHGDGIAYHMVNCAHPSHFGSALGDPALAARIGGLRANASRMSHAELDEAAELDDGNPAELAADYRALVDHLPNLCVLGGCCGTDHRHVDAIAAACIPALAERSSRG